MTTITIRDVPEAVRDQLASRAAREGRSMQSYLLERLADLATRPTMDEVIDRARVRVERSHSSVTAAEILEDLQADRR